jgi:hypothetical protein
MTEHDVQRTAQMLIDRHGDDALRVATERAEALAAQGNAEAGKDWRQVVTRIRDLRTLVVPFSIC